MQTEETIPAREFCIHHNIELSFINSLSDYGLVALLREDEELLVPVDQLACLEKLVRMRYELDINLEGIETIVYMLQRMADMQQEVTRLTNRLRRYEDD